MSYLMAKNLRASMSGYSRTGLGLSLSDLTSAVQNYGSTVKPVTPAASGVLSNVTTAMQNLFASSTPSPAQQAAPAPAAPRGMSTVAKVGIGVGAVGVGLLVVSALKKRK